MNGQIVREAIDFAIKKHEGQFRRKSGLQYITHCIEVYGIVKKFKESRNIDSILCAALLHDTMEDCGVSYEELEKRFCKMTADLVLELTNDKEEIKRLGKDEYMKIKFLGLSSYAKVIKLADMLSNITDSGSETLYRRFEGVMEYCALNGVEFSRTHLAIIRQIKEFIIEMRD